MQLTCRAFYPSRLISLEDLSFGAIGHRDVYLHYNIMGLDGAWLLVLKSQKMTHSSVSEIVTQSCKIIQRLCSEQFHV